MRFPTYVPTVVRAQISTMLDGSPEEGAGWRQLLEDAESHLAKIELAIEANVPTGIETIQDRLRVLKAEANVERNAVLQDIECVERLVQDARMRDVYSSLASDFSDSQWRSFIHAAWAARVNYAKYRDRLTQAEYLRREIVSTAKALASLLTKFEQTGSMAPAEFSDITALLRGTDNDKDRGRNLHMWRLMRSRVLGEEPENEEPKPEHKPASATDFRARFLDSQVKLEIDPSKAARSDIRYAWSTAPDLSSLLETVAKVAEELRPREHGMIGSAIESRKSNVKTEYIRAFGHLLTDLHTFLLTPKIKRAMVIVSNVVTNDPDIDVTYDDVRKALSH